MSTKQRSAVLQPAFILLASLAMIMGAYGFQFIGEMEPCQMCYWQRYPYYVVIVLSALAVFFAAESAQSRIPKWIMGLCALAFLVGAAIAGYHAGVEYKWWEGPEGCTVGDSFGDTAEAFLRAIQGRGVVRCDEAPWSLFGVSMAGYNFFISLGLAFVSLHFAYDLKGRR